MISAINMAVSDCKSCGKKGLKIFCSRLPKIEDIKLIVSKGVETVYFFGKVSDSDTVGFINALTSQGTFLEIIKLEK